MPRRVTLSRPTRKQREIAAAEAQRADDEMLGYIYGFAPDESENVGELADLLLDIRAIALADVVDELLEEYANPPPVDREGLYKLDGVLFRVLRSQSTGRLFAMRVQDGHSQYIKGAIYALRPSDRL